MALFYLTYLVSLVLGYALLVVNAITKFGYHGDSLTCWALLIAPLPLGFALTWLIPFVRKNLGARGLAAPVLGLLIVGGFMRYVLLA